MAKFDYAFGLFCQLGWNERREGAGVLRATRKMAEEFRHALVLKQFWPLLAAFVLTGCEVLEASPYPVIDDADSLHGGNSDDA